MDGNFGTISYTEERARGAHHPPVIRTAAVKADNGEYPLGLVVSKDINGDVVPYDVAETFYGVLDEKCDTATTSAAMCIVHGSVRLDALKANIAGDAPDAALLAILFEAGIYEE